MAGSPSAVTIRAYQVGFGDCFLVTFHYGGGKDRHILIDFGSTGAPQGFGDMAAVAESIRDECGGKLHAVVATHRHKDHISGFSTDGPNSGGIIAACDPDVVIQPWTEDPDAQPDAEEATTASSGSRKAFTAALHNMHSVARSLLQEVPRLEELVEGGDDVEGDDEEADEVAATPAAARRRRPLFKRLQFMGENNLPNLSAVRNLMTMGRRHVYVDAGSKSGLERLLPGVKVSVLGPPNLKQTKTISKQRQRDESEFWQFQAMASRRAASPTTERLFPGAPVLVGRERPRRSRWLLPRLRAIRGEQLREIVRVLDKAMNNTSVILLFEVGRQKLLFPGDAQIENWQFALDQEDLRERLADVTFYKVGHHGSLNATPRSLWNAFSRRGAETKRGRLRTMVSTMKGKHGDPLRSTEVPRTTLVDALTAESRFFTTQTIKVRDGALFHAERIEL